MSAEEEQKKNRDTLTNFGAEHTEQNLAIIADLRKRFTRISRVAWGQAKASVVQSSSERVPFLKVPKSTGADEDQKISPYAVTDEELEACTLPPTWDPEHFFLVKASILHAEDKKSIKKLGVDWTFVDLSVSLNRTTKEAAPSKLGRGKLPEPAEAEEEKTPQVALPEGTAPKEEAPQEKEPPPQGGGADGHATGGNEPAPAREAAPRVRPRDLLRHKSGELDVAEEMMHYNKGVEECLKHNLITSVDALDPTVVKWLSRFRLKYEGLKKAASEEAMQDVEAFPKVVSLELLDKEGTWGSLREISAELKALSNLDIHVFPRRGWMEALITMGDYELGSDSVADFSYLKAESMNLLSSSTVYKMFQAANTKARLSNLKKNTGLRVEDRLARVQDLLKKAPEDPDLLFAKVMLSQTLGSSEKVGYLLEKPGRFDMLKEWLPDSTLRFVEHLVSPKACRSSKDFAAGVELLVNSDCLKKISAGVVRSICVDYVSMKKVEHEESQKFAIALVQEKAHQKLNVPHKKEPFPDLSATKHKTDVAVLSASALRSGGAVKELPAHVRLAALVQEVKKAEEEEKQAEAKKKQEQEEAQKKEEARRRKAEKDEASKNEAEPANKKLKTGEGPQEEKEGGADQGAAAGGQAPQVEEKKDKDGKEEEKNQEPGHVEGPKRGGPAGGEDSSGAAKGEKGEGSKGAASASAAAEIAGEADGTGKSLKEGQRVEVHFSPTGKDWALDGTKGVIMRKRGRDVLVKLDGNDGPPFQRPFSMVVPLSSPGAAAAGAASKPEEKKQKCSLQDLFGSAKVNKALDP